MLRTLIALSLVAAPVAAVAAQTQADPDPNTRTLAEAQASAGETPAAKDQTASLAQANTPPQTVRSVTVVGNEKCPKSSGGEIIVCSRIGEGDRYRIPSQFRQLPNPAANNSWVNRVDQIDDVSRQAAGLPNTCSPVGDGGQTGCAMQAFQQYQDSKRQQQREQDSIP